MKKSLTQMARLWAFPAAALLLLSNCTQRSSDSDMDMNILLKAKEDMDKVNHGFETLQASIGKMSDKIDSLEKAAAAAALKASSADAIATDIKELKSGLADLEILIKKNAIAATEQGGANSGNSGDQGNSNGGNNNTASNNTPARPNPIPTQPVATEKPMEASEVHKIDLRKP